MYSFSEAALIDLLEEVLMMVLRATNDGCTCWKWAKNEC